MKNFIRAFVLLAAVGASAPAMASSLVIGNGTGGNCFPFGCKISGQPSSVYQQVYSAAAFGSSPLSISGVSFATTSGGPNGGAYTLSLSTTSKSVNGLDTSIFANNIGGDDTQVFSGTLAGQFASGVLSFAFAPFAFDPGAGNLLLNVNVSGNPDGFPGFFLANNGSAGGVYSRAHNFGSGFSDFGLVTTFDVGTGVPEPASWALMIAGFGLIGGAMRRRTRVIVTYA